MHLPLHPNGQYPAEWARLTFQALTTVMHRHCSSQDMRTRLADLKRPMEALMQEFVVENDEPAIVPSPSPEPARSRGSNRQSSGQARGKKQPSAKSSAKVKATAQKASGAKAKPANRSSNSNGAAADKLLAAWKEINAHKFAIPFRKPVRHYRSKGGSNNQHNNCLIPPGQGIQRTRLL